MGIFEEFIDDLTNVVKKGTESAKTTVNVAEQERLIKKMTTEIGNLIMVELDEGKTFGPAIMERYQTILAARAIIEDSKQDQAPTKKTCPTCGKANSLDMKYCGFCGADMDIIPEPEEEAQPEE